MRIVCAIVKYTVLILKLIFSIVDLILVTVFVLMVVIGGHFEDRVLA